MTITQKCVGNAIGSQNIFNDSVYAIFHSGRRTYQQGQSIFSKYDLPGYHHVAGVIGRYRVHPLAGLVFWTGGTGERAEVINTQGEAAGWHVGGVNPACVKMGRE